MVSENNSKGVKPPEVSGGYITIEADNWHFHLGQEAVDGIQFVEAKGWEETLARCYFPNPYLDDDHKRTEFQEDKHQLFQRMRDKYVGTEGIVFVERASQPSS